MFDPSLNLYNYKFQHVRTVDGDTVQGNVDLGFNVFTFQTFRLNGINTPELNSSDPLLKEQANLAKSYTDDFFKKVAEQKYQVIVQSNKPITKDKYGRFLGTFGYYLPTSSSIFFVSLNEELIKNGLAKPY